MEPNRIKEQVARAVLEAARIQVTNAIAHLDGVEGVQVREEGALETLVTVKTMRHGTLGYRIRVSEVQ